jgi:hypothetical protein
VCKPNTRVASCAFNNGTARTQQAGFFSVLDDEEGSAVLDTAARVLELGFAEDVTARLFGDLFETD